MYCYVNKIGRGHAFFAIYHYANKIGLGCAMRNIQVNLPPSLPAYCSSSLSFLLFSIHTDSGKGTLNMA